MYDNIVFRTFVKITYCDKAFLIKDYHHHHHHQDQVIIGEYSPRRGVEV